MVPSVTSASSAFLGGIARLIRNATMSTTSSATITGTLSQSRSNWMLRIQAALSSSDAATQ